MKTHHKVIGFLAELFFKETRPVEVVDVQTDFARFAIGTLRDDGTVLTQESAERWETEEEAQSALKAYAWEQSFLPRPKTSYLAEIFDGKVIPLMPYKSNAGWYLGTRLEDGTPNTRDSLEYWKTREEAQKALKTGKWEQRRSP